MGDIGLYGGTGTSVHAAFGQADKYGWAKVDHFSSAMGRPDRMIDSYHYFPKKCRVTCELGRRKIEGCCLAADAMPIGNPVATVWATQILNEVCTAR